MAKSKEKGPSLSTLAALCTLALALWFEVDLATALFRAIIVYLVLSLIIMSYRVVLGRFLAISQKKEQEEILARIQREVEEEEARKKADKEKREQEQKNRENAAANKAPQPGKPPPMAAPNAAPKPVKPNSKG